MSDTESDPQTDPEAEGDLPPEQSANPATGEPHPDQPPLKDHGDRIGG